jgi:microcystin-dependent protein
MRLKIEKNNTQTLTSITVTGSLFLFADPIDPLEAATKQYVDNAYLNLNASNITSGTLATARFPAFTGGDVVSSSGSNTLTLTNTGVAAGTYTKVTVDVKGRVTSATSITAADIPNLDWSIITSGKPTTLSGYGITDGVLLSGDSVTGYVSTSQTFNAGNQIVNKQYVDSAIAANTTSGYSVGDITTFPTSTTPPGFLKCDGSLVSKTTYSALYAVIGDTFTPSSGVGGNGKPWQLQYDFNTTQTANLSPFVSAGTLPDYLEYGQAVITKNKLFLIGCSNNTGSTTTVHVANINTDGTLGTWSTSAPLPSSSYSSQLAVTKNRIYVMGGSGSTAVYTAQINADGTLGTWNTGPSLPEPRYGGQAIIVNNRLHIIGGYNGLNTATNVYLSASLNADGTINSWNTVTALGPGGNPQGTDGYTQVIATNNRIYTFSTDYNIANTPTYMTMFTAPINSDGTLGTWTSVPNTTIQGLYGINAISTRNKVYLIGGKRTVDQGYYDTDLNEWVPYIVTYYNDSVYVANINSDGTLGTWSQVNNMFPNSNLATAFSQIAITSSKVYLLGGEATETNTNAIYSTSFSGGYNDYSGFYNPIPPDPTKFGLPDFSGQDVASNIYHYIKY